MRHRADVGFKFLMLVHPQVNDYTGTVFATFLAARSGFVPPKISMANNEADFGLETGHASGLVFIVELRGGFGNGYLAEFVHHFLRQLSDVKGFLLIPA
jgi:hypothetical protein